MDFCTPHFGKPLNDLTLEDVSNFFSTEKIETDQLEFKSFGGLANDNYKGITRTICAFLNSKGGLLIWGAPAGTDVAGRNEKVFLGELSLINQVLVKDALISKVSDSITPLPSGIRVKVIVQDVNCVCVFEVDESNYSPHQFDKSYVMRIDGQTKPAPHHYIEALFRRIKYPEVEGYLKFTRITSARKFVLLRT
jgi:predicted HTH transcriptional regulator